MHEPRHDWTLAEAEALYALPFPELLFRAQQVHRDWHDPTEVQMSTLLSIKTGACPEDCAYCPQSIRFDTGVANEALLPLETVIERARAARAAGATRFCMGAAWRSPKPKDLQKVTAMVRAVHALGLETCVTLGMVSDAQARGAQAGGPRLLQPQPRHLRRITTARSFPPAPTRTGSTRSRRCAPPA